MKGNSRAESDRETSLASRREERGHRVGENESMFRDVNERVRSAKAGRTTWTGISQWLCECADESCAERIMMSLEEYEQVRSNATHFVVAPDGLHVVSGAERVVEKNERFWVVEKVGEAAEVAEERDVR